MMPQRDELIAHSHQSQTHIRGPSCIIVLADCRGLPGRDRLRCFKGIVRSKLEFYPCVRHRYADGGGVSQRMSTVATEQRKKNRTCLHTARVVPSVRPEGAAVQFDSKRGRDRHVFSRNIRRSLQAESHVHVGAHEVNGLCSKSSCSAALEITASSRMLNIAASSEAKVNILG